MTAIPRRRWSTEIDREQLLYVAQWQILIIVVVAGRTRRGARGENATSGPGGVADGRLKHHQTASVVDAAVLLLLLMLTSVGQFIWLPRQRL